MADPDLTLPQQEAGALFRLEMAATSFLLGYWRHIVAIVAVGLLTVLVYGQYTSIHRKNQRAMSAQIAEAWVDIPPEAVPGQLTEAQEIAIREVADTVVALGAEFNGAAAAEAYIRSAELYRVLGDSEAQRKALESAVPYARGALLFAARSGLANLDLEAGNADAAIATWRDLMTTMDGWLAEEAALSLAQVYAHQGRASDARGVYVEFQARWPGSPRMSVVTDKLAHLDAARPEEAPAPSLAPAPLEPLDAPAPVEPVPSEGAPE